MLVSALLTSVGINFGLCILYFTLYSILRKQPYNVDVYAPRLVAEGKSQQSSHFNLERLLPSPGWVKSAWNLSEEELLSTAGLDAVVFMRIITFGLKIFSVAGVIGIFILLPINFVGQDTDFSDLAAKSLDVFSISNLKDGSKRLWFHFCAIYLLTGVICYLLYHEFKYVSSMRVAYFYSSKPQPDQFTILVRGIPTSSGRTFSDTVESFFAEYHSSTYLSHNVVRRASKLYGLIAEADKLYKRLTHLKSNSHGPQKFHRSGLMGLFGPKIDLVDSYEKKLEDIEQNVRMQQSDVSSPGQDVPAAFVSFKSRYGAAVAFHLQQSVNPTEWITEQAPEPRDVYWPFFSSSFVHRWISKVVAIVASVILTLIFVIPVLFVQGLTNLNQLEAWLPFLKAILTLTFVSEVITGYLPSLILQLFLSVVPPIMKIFSSMQGYISQSQIEKSACSKVVWFTIWNIFFANVLSGSVLSQLDFLLEPKNIPMELAIAVPGQASFFISYVVTSGWTFISSELFRTKPLIWHCMRRRAKRDNDEFDVPSIPYHSEIPRVLFFELLGIVYFFLAPLILPFLLAFYCLGYIVFRNQLSNVYASKYETGGKFWPTVYSSTIFSLILMQAIAVGIFGLKKLPLASTLTVPLVVFTFLFNAYCRKRFLPIFADYSAESLIKKDKEDENDRTMVDFFHKLVNTYQDPALMPIKYSNNASEHSTTTPLLAEV